DWALARFAVVVPLVDAGNAFQIDAGLVAQAREPALRVVDIGDPAGHAGGEVAARLAENGDDAAGHVFAAVVAGALDDRDSARVPDREALAGHALEIRFAGDRPVQHRVADDDVIRRLQLAGARLAHDHPPAAQALADIVVGVAEQLDRYAMCQKRAKAAARRAVEPNPDRILRQPAMAVALGDLARQHRPDRAVDVADRVFEAHRLPPFERRRGIGDQRLVERFVEMMVLPLAMI